MKKIAFLLIHLVSFTFYAQSEITYDSSSYLGGNIENTSLRACVGMLIPQNESGDFIGVSPLLELSLNVPIEERKSLDLSMQFSVPSSENKFAYQPKDISLKAESTFMYNLFLRFNKTLLQKDNYRFVFGLGAGISLINGSVDNSNNVFKDEVKFDSVVSPLVSPGLEIEKKFRGGKEAISFKIHFQYSPYKKTNTSLKEDIGSIFLIPQLAFKF